MKRILVTGGTGDLGRQVVERLQRESYVVRVMSRRTGIPQDNLEWAQADILTGEGLEQAVAAVDVIVNCMSDPGKNTHQVDVEGTRLLLEKAKVAKVAHVLHISIVGIERIPLPYYKEKVAAEEVVKAGGVPWSILRATQFHSFIDSLLRGSPKLLSMMLVPTDFKIQPIDAREVADQMVSHVETPAGMLPDIGGPEVLTAGEMAAHWLKAQGMKRIILPLPLPGKVGAGFRQGYNTCPDHRTGKITWPEWLQRMYGMQSPRAERHSTVTS